MRRPAVVLTILAVLLAAAALAASLTRIARGEVGAARSGWLRSGWRLRVPFSSVLRLPESAPIEVGPLEGVTPQGATHRFRVALRYRITPAADPALAAEAAREGFDRALGRVLSAALTEALRSRSAGEISTRSGSGSDSLGSALVKALDLRGVAAEDLDWRRLAETASAPVLALPPPARKKLLVIGLDAADWEIVDPLIRRGRLQNLARLVRAGCRAPLRSYDPMMSPLIWTTIVTGVGPDLHGVADFTVTDAGTGRQVPITSRFRKVKAIWNVLTDAGLGSGFIGWWASYPAEPVKGYLVTDLVGFSLLRPGASGGAGRSGVTFPDSYFSEIRPKLVLPDGVTYEEVSRLLHVTRSEFETAVDDRTKEAPAPGVSRPVQDPVWLVRRSLAMTRNYEAIALDLLGKDLDVVGVYFEGIDMMGHRFQHCAPPRMSECPDDEFEREKDAVEAFYELQDGVIGRLVDSAPGRTIVVVSDHGFRSGPDRPRDILPYTTGQPVEWHREWGILILSGPGARRGAALDKASVYDVGPTLLYLAGLPASEDMTGEVLVGALDPAEVAANPPRRIPSYEDVGGVRATPEVTLSAEAQQEMMENLQALGYVGPAPASAAAQEPGSRRAEGASGAGARSPAGAPGALSGTVAVPGAAGTNGRGPAAGGETTRVTYHRNLATYYMKAGRLEQAEAELLQANRIQPLPKSYELLSEMRPQAGDIEGAVGYLEEGLRTFREMDDEAVLWIVDLRLSQARGDLAAEALGRWRERLSRPAVLAACEGKLAASRGEEARALDSLLRALALEPTLSQAALAAAPLLAARGRLADLEPAVARALAAEKRLDEYQNLLGLIRLEERRPAEAMEAIGKALAVAPENPRFLENYTAAALTAGRPASAVERYREALKSPQARGAVWAGYGRLLGVSRRPADAAAAFERALSLGEKSAATYAGYATSLFQAGRKDRSREVLREALRAYPGDAALQALVRTLG